MLDSFQSLNSHNSQAFEEQMNSAEFSPRFKLNLVIQSLNSIHDFQGFTGNNFGSFSPNKTEQINLFSGIQFESNNIHIKETNLKIRPILKNSPVKENKTWSSPGKSMRPCQKENSPNRSPNRSPVRM